MSRILFLLIAGLLWTTAAAAQVTNPSSIRFSHTDYAITDYYRIGYFAAANATIPTSTGILAKPVSCSPCSGPLPNVPTTNQTWYLGIQATNSAGSSSWTSPLIAFVVNSAPPLPSNIVPIFPPDGATGVTTTLLQWDAIDATSYNIGLGLSSPPPTLVTGITSKSYIPPTPNPGSTYFWQITAINSTGAVLGAVWSFTAASPQPVWDAPYSVSVLPAAMSPTTIIFYHAAFAVASSYTLTYYRTATASNPAQTVTLAKPLTCSPCSITIPSRPRKTWYLAVRANRSNGTPSAYSTPRVKVTW